MTAPDVAAHAAAAVPGALLPLVPIAAAAFALYAAGGCACVLDAIAGASSRAPGDMARDLSPAARALLERCYADVDRSRLVDYHCHIVGLGEGGSGCYVNPHMLSWRHPKDRVKFLAYKSAGQIEDESRAESEFVARLAALARGHGGRFVLLAFDEHFGPDGAVIPEKTEFHVPDAHARKVAAETPDLFVAAASVHPYRKDALEALDRAAAAGTRIVKWLPNAMGIDPSDPRCVPFYDRMKAHGMVLLSHGGEEKAVDAEEDQRLGNPLLLRTALERGLRVICAHCAGLGTDMDLDDPARPRVPSWDLFLRMMDEPRWRGLLFGDISAATQANRTPEPLRTLILREDLHDRLVNGSDYPLPAVNVVISTKRLVRLGMIPAEERAALNEIYDFNPIVFDYALKRCLRVRGEDGRERRFAPSMFVEHPALAPTRE